MDGTLILISGFVDIRFEVASHTFLLNGLPDESIVLLIGLFQIKRKLCDLVVEFVALGLKFSIPCSSFLTISVDMGNCSFIATIFS